MIEVCSTNKCCRSFAGGEQTPAPAPAKLIKTPAPAPALVHSTTSRRYLGDNYNYKAFCSIRFFRLAIISGCNAS